MPLFGKKKDNKMDMPEVVDFSNDIWSYKGNPPDYQIQSDGFTYDILDADSNDKNAISLGLSGMLVIVLNAKSPKIKEDEILPPFGKVIKTRNWHSMTVKEANFLVQTAIKKLTNSATSGDVFDLASYAPLEIKRVLLKTLFTISRMQLPPECREEAEHRIIDDIVPDIFANPDYELALLTGLIVKPDEKQAQPASSRIETSPVIDPDSRYNTGANYYQPEESVDQTSQTNSDPTPEPDSAFAELQKIYGRKIDTMPRREPASQFSAQGNMPGSSVNNEQNRNVSGEVPSYNPAPVSNPVSSNEEVRSSQGAAPEFSGPQPGNPFANREPQNIPQPGNPFAVNRNYPYQQQFIPQPPMPNSGMMQQNVPFPQAPYGNPNPGYPQMNPNIGNFQQFPQQMYQPNMPMQPNSNTQNSPAPQFPPQGWMQNQQNIQNAQNQQWQAPNPAQPFAGPNPQWQPNQQQPPNQQQNRGPYMPPAPQQNTQNN